MNWEALGSMGEVAGAIGVIVTLIYLARQIRESNLAARQSGTQEIQNQNQQLLSNIGNSTEIARLWIRGHTEAEDLTTEERVQFRTLLMQMMMIWERTYSLYHAGRLDEEFWDTMSRHRQHMMASRGFRSFFNDRKHQFHPRFQAFIEQEQERAEAEWRPVGVNLGDALAADGQEKASGMHNTGSD